MIAIGGGLLLLLNAEKECEGCDTLEEVNDFSEEVKSTQQIGYIFIIVGELLVAIDI